MRPKRPVLFDRALEVAVEKTREFAATLEDNPVLVRDLLGRIRVLLPGGRDDQPPDRQSSLDNFSLELSEALGAYGYDADKLVLFSTDLFQGDEILDSPDRRLIVEQDELKIWLLDRQITGQDWMRGPLPRATTTPRVTFFGIKGGVGRSTVLVIWAWYLARQGKKVLVFDLDLESPGVSSTLLSQEYFPDYGMVDWFVEDGVGQAGIIENDMVAASPLAKDLVGEIRIVPAFGKRTGDYLPKLARCYMDIAKDGTGAWGERVQRAVTEIEEREKPDVVFLDSRAGLHDIAAVLVTRMGADAFLFGADSAQTWQAYSFLFQSWKNHPNVTDFRRHLQMVASMIPETGGEEYLSRFQEHSWDLFREHLYDTVSPDDVDAFSFDVADEDAPHYPLRVFWHRALQEFDPARSETGLDEKTSRDAMSDFMDVAQRIVFPDTSGD